MADRTPLPATPPASSPLRLLAIDPALRNTGYAILEGSANTAKALTYGVLRNATSLSQTGCLLANFEGIRELIESYKPTICAVESIIYVQSLKTAITMGAARASALIAAAQAGLTIYEYPPRRVKQAVVGKGAADKQQVAFMTRVLLGLEEMPPHDAADALAVGITHLQSLNPLRAAQKSPPAAF